MVIPADPEEFYNTTQDKYQWWCENCGSIFIAKSNNNECKSCKKEHDLNKIPPRI